jgi:hypothetical protein
MIEDQRLLGSLMSTRQLNPVFWMRQLTSSNSTLKVLAFENISIISHSLLATVDMIQTTYCHKPPF